MFNIHTDPVKVSVEIENEEQKDYHTFKKKQQLQLVNQ